MELFDFGAQCPIVLDSSESNTGNEDVNDLAVDAPTSGEDSVLGLTLGKSLGLSLETLSPDS